MNVRRYVSRLVGVMALGYLGGFALGCLLHGVSLLAYGYGFEGALSLGIGMGLYFAGPVGLVVGTPTYFAFLRRTSPVKAFAVTGAGAMLVGLPLALVEDPVAPMAGAIAGFIGGAVLLNRRQTIIELTETSH